MTSKRGRAKRKAVIASELIEEPPLVINCVCPACDASINPSQIIGDYLDRRCPICNHSIKPEDFDELASHVLQDLKRTREKKTLFRKDRNSSNISTNNLILSFCVLSRGLSVKAKKCARRVFCCSKNPTSP